MRRLSIIDLASDWQPLYNEDRSLALVAKGQIYNFVELRRDLEAPGYRFSTGSDCEIIPHLYEEYGARFVNHPRRAEIVPSRLGAHATHLQREEQHSHFSGPQPLAGMSLVLENWWRHMSCRLLSIVS
jgi:glutamine phosphoribosylpyrophosphate amidotransferase